MKTDDSLKVLITARFRLKNERSRQQLKLIGDESIFADAILMKLDGIASGASWENFNRCSKEEIYKTCENCRSVTKYFYQCSLKWCPRCNWRISRRRAELIKRWQPLIRNPKHIVVTMRNFPVLTRKRIAQFIKALSKLRRSKCFEKVLGGCTSIEMTNEGNGWHLHAHILCNATFVCMNELAIVWGKLVNQNYGIVHFDDCSKTDYCNEVCKYVVKGSEMAKWDGQEIWEFICAIRGRRFFFQFGTLLKMAPQIRREINADKPEAEPCDCGCVEFRYESEVDAILNQIRREGKRR